MCSGFLCVSWTKIKIPSLAYFRLFMGVKDLDLFFLKWIGVPLCPNRRLKESWDRSDRTTTWGDAPDRRIRLLPDDEVATGSDLRLRLLLLALPVLLLLLLLTWFSVSLAFRSSLATSRRDRVIGLLRDRQAGSIVTTFLRMVISWEPRGGVADDGAAVNFLLLNLLFSKLSDVGIRLRSTLRGVATASGVVSKGRLVSRQAGGTGVTSLTAGADRRAASSDGLFTGVCTRSSKVSVPSLSDNAGSGSATTSSGLRTGGMRRPESGGPGGSSNAVTAVQLSARNLFIIQ
jgi:hypothetical protein